MAKPYIFLALAFIPAKAPAEPLARQTAAGIHRVCYYAPATGQRRRMPDARSGRNQAGEFELRIGLGEPCPPYYSRSAAERRREAARVAPRIPSMAILSGTTERGLQRVCIYSYLGQEYRQTVDRTVSCPLTPHFR